MAYEERRPAGRRQEQPRERAVGRTPRKKRRRRGSAGGTLLYVAFVIGISTLLAAVGWVAANDVLALNKEERSAIITVAEGETFNEVVDDLKENGLIEFKSVFHLYSVFSHAADKITPGTYQLDTNMDYRAIVTNLGSKSPNRQKVTVTIPEGFTVAQIFGRLEEYGVSTVAKLNDMASTHDYNFSFLKEIPLGSPDRLEGYLFPDTYEFYLNEKPASAIKRLLDNFNRKMTEERMQAVEESGYSLKEIITIASLIEKETDGTDHAKIASVIYNRLNDSGSHGTYKMLNIDAALLYALPDHEGALTNADKKVDSPYNLYTHAGLPPTPIANPGIASIDAALHPETTDYYYYALGKDGKHHFSTTLSEHNAFLASGNYGG